MTVPRPHWLLAWLLAAALAPAAGLTAQAAPRAETCVDCHLRQTAARLREPAERFRKDVHAAKGFGCLDCHGASALAAGAAGGFLAKPERRAIPQLCGRCHSDAAFMRDYNPSLRVDQVTEYYSSRHGRLLRDANDPDVATCVDCHPPHGTLPPTDPASSVFPGNVAETCGACHAKPRLSARGLPIDQLEQYRASVHGRLLLEDGDMSAPTCNDCHGNHGAAPPGVESVRNVCGQCHATIAEFFDQSGHEPVFAAHGLPGCAACHGRHDIQAPDDAALGLRNELVCGRCHAAGDAHGNEFLLMQTLFDSVAQEQVRSSALLRRAENAGMEVSQAQFNLEDASDALVRARAAVHSFQLEPVRAEINAGLEITSTARRRGEDALSEHRFRRVGLAMSTSMIVIVILGLVARIRDLDARVPGSGGTQRPGRTGEP